MLEVGDEHKMHVGNHPREDEELDHRQHSEDAHAVDQAAEASEEGEVGLDDEPVLLRLEEDRGGGEVVHVLPSVLGGSCGSEDEVAGHPAHGEHEEDAPEVGDGGLS